VRVFSSAAWAVSSKDTAGLEPDYDYIIVGAGSLDRLFDRRLVRHRCLLRSPVRESRAPVAVVSRGGLPTLACVAMQLSEVILLTRERRIKRCEFEGV
jgi:hypothetical protein